MKAEAKSGVSTAIAVGLLVVGLVIGAVVVYGFGISTTAKTATKTTTSVSTVTNTATSISFVTVTSTTQSTSEVQSSGFNGPDGQNKLIISWVANHAGYAVVTGTSTNANFYVVVTDSFAGYPLNSYQYSFGYGTTLYIPVLPGSVVVYVGAPCGVLGCTLQGGSWSATLSVTYYG